MAEDRAWDGLAVAVSLDRVLLGREAAAVLLSLIAHAELVALRDAVTLSPALRQIRAVLRVVADTSGHPHGASGHADMPDQPSMPASGYLARLIGTQEAAQILRLSTRQVRRLARDGSLGPVRRAGRAIELDEAEVRAYREWRQAG